MNRLSHRLLHTAVLLLLLISNVLAQRRKNTTKALFYMCIGFIVLFVILIGSYILRKLCPEGPRFAPVELDDIRIERLDDIEANLQNNINSLKTKLAYHRKKKTVVQTNRDIKLRINETVERFNDRGSEIYGEAWESGEVPAKEVVNLTQNEVKSLRDEAEEIVKTRQEEEKEDLWLLWNDMKSGNGGKPGNVIGPYNPSMSTAAVAGAGIGMGGDGSIKGSGRQGRVTLYANNNNSKANQFESSQRTHLKVQIAPDHIKPPSKTSNSSVSLNRKASNRFPTKEKTVNEMLSQGEQYSMNIQLPEHRISDKTVKKGGFNKNRRPSFEGKELLPRQPMQLARPGTADREAPPVPLRGSPGYIRPAPPSIPPPPGPSPYKGSSNPLLGSDITRKPSPPKQPHPQAKNKAV